LYIGYFWFFVVFQEKTEKIKKVAKATFLMQ